MATSDYNFRAFTIPGISELQAYSMGVQSVFNANTPASYVNSVMNTLGSFYQNPNARIASSAEWDRILRGGVPGDGSQEGNVYTVDGAGAGTVTPAPQTPGINPAANDPRIPMPRVNSGQLPTGAPGNTNPGGQDNSVFTKIANANPIEQLKQWLKDSDAGTRTALVLLALVLIGVGVISLR